MARRIYPRPLPIFIGPRAGEMNARLEDLVRRDYGKQSDDRHRDID